ncbi:MAG: proprotein convertase P-domain-containing protein [Myxococcota bacterium]|nr:proprotein convertase P-domain-containing protein [Myxococcota bacterium]
MRSVLTALCLLATTAHAVPAQFTHQGRLLDADGAPLEGEATITFRVTVAETGGDVVWEEPITVSLVNGFYSAVLGADEESNPLDADAFSHAPVWLELQLDGEPAMFPRSPINAVPYAAMATVAEEVAGGPVDASAISVGGTPVINESGEWVGPPASVSWDDIEGAPDDDASDSFADLGASCLDGNIPTWDAALGAWACGSDADTQLTESDVDAMVADNGYAMSSEVFTGSFLDLDDVPAGLEDGDDNDDSFADLGASCTGDGIARWDATLGAWTCGDDADALGALDCSDGQLAVWSADAGAWICDDASGGGGGSTSADLTIGSSDGGVSATSGDTPIIIPDDNAEGISSIQFLGGADAFAELQTVSVDVEITHPDMSQITIKLHSPPPGPVITLYDGGDAGEANLDTNFGWVTSFAEGDIYSFYNGEDIAGTWRLQVIDAGAGGTGTLDSWTVHFNEEWNGSLFVGDNLTVPGTVEVREELRVARGAELVFTDIDGTETARLNGNGGFVPPGGIIMWSGTDIPDGWALCDGSDGTPDLRNRFVVASGGAYATGDSGPASIDLSVSTASGYPWSGGGGRSFVRSVSASNITPPYYALAYIMRK